MIKKFFVDLIDGTVTTEKIHSFYKGFFRIKDAEEFSVKLKKQQKKEIQNCCCNEKNKRNLFNVYFVHSKNSIIILKNEKTNNKDYELLYRTGIKN